MQSKIKIQRREVKGKREGRREKGKGQKHLFDCKVLFVFFLILYYFIFIYSFSFLFLFKLGLEI